MFEPGKYIAYDRFQKFNSFSLIVLDLALNLDINRL